MIEEEFALEEEFVRIVRIEACSACTIIARNFPFFPSLLVFSSSF
jgi:hypothetical protein